MNPIHSAAHFLRWRLIPVRYAGKFFARGRGHRSRTATAACVQRDGHTQGLDLPSDVVREINSIYRPRIARVVQSDRGHPFVNLFSAEDIRPSNPVFNLAFSPAVLDVATDYFGGRLVLDSIQALYSWPTAGALRESQKWHKDYGDSQSFHWIAYMNDVRSADDGPFVYVDKHHTKRIRRSPFIRRIDDAQFSRELGDGNVLQFVGNAGASLFMDPAVCYHYGSRCRNGRLALFVTFNTDRPFVSPTDLVVANKAAIHSAAKLVRPELSDEFLRGLLQIN